MQLSLLSVSRRSGLRWLLLLLLLGLLVLSLLLLLLLLLRVCSSSLLLLMLRLLLLSQASLFDEVSIYERSDLRGVLLDSEVQVLVLSELVRHILCAAVLREERHKRATDQMTQTLLHGRRHRQQICSDGHGSGAGFEAR